MRRFFRFLRASILPLFALASLALFAWGVVGWWRFHRDLFVEEEAALVALAQETGTLRYRRTGALRTKLLDARGLDDVPTPVPWSVPFVGRVEFIDASAGLEPNPVDERLVQAGSPLGYAVGAYWDPTAAASQASTAAIIAAAAAGAAVPTNSQNPAIAASLSPSAALSPPLFPPGTFPSTTTPRTTPAARDRALRLPGLREFRDLPPVAVDAEPIDLAALSLTLPPPKFPTAYLHPDHLSEPFPSGKSLGSEEREALATEIADAWADQAKNAKAEEKPRLIYVHRRTIDKQSRRLDRSTSIRLRDGANRFDFSALPHELDASIRRPANLRASTAEGAWEFLVTKTSMFPLARRLASDDARDREAFDDAPDLAHSLGRPFDPYGHMEPLPDDPLGDGGRYVVAMERVDRQRLRIEARSAEENVPGEGYWRFRAIVRTDYDFAVEQFDWYLRHAEPRPDPSTPRELIYREIRWLSHRKGTTIVTERLSDPWPIAATATGAGPNAAFPEQGPAAGVATHSLIATTVDPIYPKEIFDPAKYGAKNWATPRELPTYRIDQIAMAVGTLGVAVAGTISLARRIFVRRRRDGVDRRRSFLAFRFGMVTVLAAALLAISAAGWFKVRVDEARDQQAILAELGRLDERLRFERGEAEFPWLFVSTEEFPIGTQLTRVDLGPQPPQELLDRLLASSPDVRLEIRERGRSVIERREAVAEQALGRELPPLEAFEWKNERLDEPIENGAPLTPEETEQTLAEMLAAWREARANPPTRYLVRRESPESAITHGVAVRDGARSWTLDFSERGPRVDADDGRVRRRFVRAGEGWRLVDRRPSTEERPPFYIVARSPAQFPQGTRSVLVNPPYGAGQYGASPYGGGRPNADPYATIPTEPVLIPSTEELTLPEPPFSLPPGAKSQARVEDVLMNPGQTGVDVSMERLPAGDLRVEVFWETTGRRIPIGDGFYSQWTLLVRPDLGWCVERCVLEERYERELTEFEALQSNRLDPYSARRSPRAAARAASYGNAKFQRKVYSRHAIEVRDGHPILLEAKVLAGETTVGNSLPLQSETIRYAVDLDPAIAGERFDRPALDSPDPSRRIEPWLPWHRATFFVGIALLGYAGIRRVVDVWTARRKKRIAAGSKEANASEEVPAHEYESRTGEGAA